MSPRRWIKNASQKSVLKYYKCQEFARIPKNQILNNKNNGNDADPNLNSNDEKVGNDLRH